MSFREVEIYNKKLIVSNFANPLINYPLYAQSGIQIQSTPPGNTVAIQSGGLVSGLIASGNIGVYHLQSGLVTSGLYKSGSIGSGQIGGYFVFASGGITASGSVWYGSIASGAVNSGDMANSSVVSGSVTARSFDASHFISGLLLNYIYGFGLTYINAQQITVNFGSTLDKSGIVLITTNAQTNIFISGTLNGAGNIDASPVGAAAQQVLSSGTTVSGFWMFSGFTWPVRSGTGTMYISGTNVVGFSGTDFVNQVAVNDLIGTWRSGLYRVATVSSGLIALAGIGGGVTNKSGAFINIIENAFFCVSGRTTSQVNNITSDQIMVLASVPGFSGNVSGMCYIGSQPNVQTNLNVFVGTGASGTASFISTQRTQPLVSGMIGYV